tara:strand:+ start:1294 stop:1851 length:558 start_codon:yes stop_codon:yes gene_type:complete
LITTSICNCYSNITITSFGNAGAPVFNVDDVYTDFTYTQNASNIDLTGTDFSFSLEGAFNTLDLSSFDEKQLILHGNVTINPSSTFILGLYDNNFNIAEYSSTNYADLSGGASMSFASYVLTAGSFDWSMVNGLVLSTSGAGSSLTFSLSGLEIVPEPSNYASIIGFVALSLALLRRRGVMVKNL